MEGRKCGSVWFSKTGDVPTVFLDFGGLWVRLTKGWPQVFLGSSENTCLFLRRSSLSEFVKGFLGWRWRRMFFGCNVSEASFYNGLLDKDLPLHPGFTVDRSFYLRWLGAIYTVSPCYLVLSLTREPSKVSIMNNYTFNLLSSFVLQALKPLESHRADERTAAIWCIRIPHLCRCVT